MYTYLCIKYVGSIPTHTNIRNIHPPACFSLVYFRLMFAASVSQLVMNLKEATELFLRVVVSKGTKVVLY